MTHHPTYIELEHQLRYDRFKEAAATNQLLQQLPKVQQHKSSIKTVISQYLGNMLINVGLKLTGSQATT